jgi:phosphate:Na+ symporter
MDILGTIFAGLGLFFIGIKLISGNLRAMSGRAFRRTIARMTERPLATAAIGVAGGALTQSTNAMTFIVISLVTSGVIELRRALPIVIWANLGTSALVLLATLDMHLMILFLLGITGLGFYLDLDKSNRYGALLGALLGIGLLFFGLDMIKIGAAPLQEFDLVREVLEMASQSLLLGFLIGVFVTLVVQSSATVSVISVTLIGVGVLTFNQSVMIVFGASLGSGLSVFLLGANLEGRGRQLALFQLLLKVSGLLLIIPLFLAEVWSGMPPLIAQLQTMVPSVDTQVALIYLLLQLASCLAMTALAAPAARLVERLSPPSQEEVLSRPRYLYAQAIEDTESALDLVEREQARLIGRLPLYLDEIRDEPAPDRDAEGAELDAQRLHRASASVAGACNAFLCELTERASAHSAFEQIINLQSRNALIVQLQESCIELVESLSFSRSEGNRGDEPLLRSIAEGMHALLATLADSLDSSARDDLDLLLEVTHDRSAVMQRVRADLLERSPTLSTAEKQQLLNATSLVERITWLVRRYVKLVQRQP